MKKSAMRSLTHARCARRARAAPSLSPWPIRDFVQSVLQIKRARPFSHAPPCALHLGELPHLGRRRVIGLVVADELARACVAAAALLPGLLLAANLEVLLQAFRIAGEITVSVIRAVCFIGRARPRSVCADTEQRSAEREPARTRIAQWPRGAPHTIIRYYGYATHDILSGYNGTHRIQWPGAQCVRRHGPRLHPRDSRPPVAPVDGASQPRDEVSCPDFGFSPEIFPGKRYCGWKEVESKMTPPEWKISYKPSRSALRSALSVLGVGDTVPYRTGCCSYVGRTDGKVVYPADTAPQSARALDSAFRPPW